MEFKRRGNGKGTVIFLGKGRYKPYAARILIGWDIEGKAIYYDIDTFTDKLDALVFLENYYKNPIPLKIKKDKYSRIALFSNTAYPLVPVEKITSQIQRKDKSNYTFRQVYEEMKNTLFPTKEEMKIERDRHIKANGKFGLHNTLSMENAYRNSTGLYDKIYKDLRTSDMQNYLSNSKKTTSTIIEMIKLYRNMDKFAFQEDIINKCYAQYLVRPEVEASNRKPFTYDQIEYLWNIKSENNKEEFVRDFLLLAIYTGCRAEELFFIYTKNIFIEDNYFVAGLKTEAGRNRVIPIHHEIKPIFEKYYNTKNEFLFMNSINTRITYSNYKSMYSNHFKIKHKVLAGQTAHCGRHTLETELQKLNIKPTIINSIIGHKNGNTGADVYNHISVKEKIEAMELVTYKNSQLYILNNTQELVNNRQKEG